MATTNNKKPSIPRYIKLPTYGQIDIDELAKKCGTTGENIVEGNVHENELSKAMLIVMDTIFKTYGGKYKKTVYVKDEEVKYEIDRHECYLAIYIQHTNITYTVRTNTNNSQEKMSCCYFAVEHMAHYVDSLLYRMMVDFSRLVYECANLPYAFEYGRAETHIPRGHFFDNGSWFCCDKEDLILTPMHYCAGIIDYENGRELIKFPFDEWLEEIRANNGRTVRQKSDEK